MMLEKLITYDIIKKYINKLIFLIYEYSYENDIPCISTTYPTRRTAKYYLKNISTINSIPLFPHKTHKQRMNIID